MTGGLRVQAGGDAGLGGLRLWLEPPGWAEGPSSAWGCGEQAAGATFTIVCHYWQASRQGAGAQWQPGRGQRHPGCRWRAQASPPWADTTPRPRGSLSWPSTVGGGGEGWSSLAMVQQEVSLCLATCPRHPPDSSKGGAPRDELTSERELGWWRTESTRERGWEAWLEGPHTSHTPPLLSNFPWLPRATPAMSQLAPLPLLRDP